MKKPRDPADRHKSYTGWGAVEREIARTAPPRRREVGRVILALVISTALVVGLFICGVIGGAFEAHASVSRRPCHKVERTVGAALGTEVITTRWTCWYGSSYTTVRYRVHPGAGS